MPVAAVIARQSSPPAILQIVATAPAHQLRQQIEQYLRAEFADLEGQAAADWELG